DGRRVFHVTGVQTCALPISVYAAGNDVRRTGEQFSGCLVQVMIAVEDFARAKLPARNPSVKTVSVRRKIHCNIQGVWRVVGIHRSEERRVGKEGETRSVRNT